MVAATGAARELWLLSDVLMSVEQKTSASAGGPDAHYENEDETSNSITA